MTLWRDEADFMKDIENISEFYTGGFHNNPGNKFVVKSRKEQKPVYTPWYESDSEEEVDNYCPSFGRRKNPGENKSARNHLEVMKEIQMQVRNAVGNRYNNDVLESYYSVCKDDAPDSTVDSPSCAPKEVSIHYAKEQNLLKNAFPENPPSKKNSIAENIQQTAAKLTDRKINSSSQASSASSSPKKGSREKERCSAIKNENQTDKFPFSSENNCIDVNSKKDFPPL